MESNFYLQAVIFYSYKIVLLSYKIHIIFGSCQNMRQCFTLAMSNTTLLLYPGMGQTMKRWEFYSGLLDRKWVEKGHSCDWSDVILFWFSLSHVLGITGLVVVVIVVLLPQFLSASYKVVGQFLCGARQFSRSQAICLF